MRDLLNNLSDDLFHPPRRGVGSRIFSNVLLVVLFVLGAIHWAAFFNYGRANLTAHDWWRQYVYLSVGEQAVAERTVPYHISRETLGTNRYLAVPETMLSPQILALPYMSMGSFALLNVLLLYSIGFVGCLLIRRRYQLSAVAFITLFLLYNFNGHITSHLGVGHPWYGYFFLPFFCLFVLELVEGRMDVSLAVWMSLCLFAMLLQGSLHIMIWCCMLLALMAVFNRAHRVPALLTFLFTGLLGMFRFAPAVMDFYDRGYKYGSGYRSLYDLFEAFVAIKEYDTFAVGSLFSRQGWWEYDLYVGVMALAAVIYLGIVVRWQKSWELGERKYKPLDLPLFIVGILSLNYFYVFIAKLPIPLINVERAPSRFMVIPFLMLLLIACIRMQEGLNRLESLGNVKWLIVPALLDTGFSLVNHSVRWSVMLFERAEREFPCDVTVRITEKEDAAYKAVVNISALVSLITFVVLVAIFLWSGFRRKRARPSGKGLNAESVHG